MEPAGRRSGDQQELLEVQDFAKQAVSVPTVSAAAYLKAAWRITHEGNSEWVGTGRLANALGFTSGAVTSMLTTLWGHGFVEYKPYVGIRLTVLGNRLAANVVRKHRLLETFLSTVLNIPWDQIHAEAERMEHAVSDVVMERIDELLAHPTHDPHGDPIPGLDGTIPCDARTLIRASEVEVGGRFRLGRVNNQEMSFLRHLTSCGLSIGVTAMLESREAVAGTLSLRIDDRSVVFSDIVASHLLVERLA